MNKNRALELVNVSFSYNENREILSKVNATFNKGSMTGIVGLSGSGKTSLIRLMNASLLKEGQYDFQGSIKLMSKDIREEKNVNRLIGSVYQDPDNQIIFTKVLDEIVFGMENKNKSHAYMETKLGQVLKLLAIEDLKLQDPNQLSGGEKQLLVLASILALDVDILILDECMTGVSLSSRQKVLSIIKDLRDQGKCIIMIEHDFENLVDADQIYELKKGALTPIKLNDFKIE